MTTRHRRQVADRRPPDEVLSVQSGRPASRQAGRQTDRHDRRAERSAGRLEMSRRVGGAESRRQAQPVSQSVIQSVAGRSCAGWAGWMGAPSVLLFLLNKNMRWSIFEKFTHVSQAPSAEEPAGGGRWSHRCSDRGRSLGGHCVLSGLWGLVGPRQIHVGPRGPWKSRCEWCEALVEHRGKRKDNKRVREGSTDQKWRAGGLAGCWPGRVGQNQKGKNGFKHVCVCFLTVV